MVYYVSWHRFWFRLQHVLYLLSAFFFKCHRGPINLCFMIPLHHSLGFDITEDDVLSDIGEDAYGLMPQHNFVDGSLAEEDMMKTLPDAM